MKNALMLIAVALALASAGCNGTALTAADPVYKQANKARLTAVEPWLKTYSTDHPADAVKVGDVVASWKIEVQSQQRTPTTAP